MSEKTLVETQAAVEALRKEETLRFGEGVKVTYDPQFPIDEIEAPDDFNVRLKAGMTVAGSKVSHDLRNIGGMAESIRALNGITTPLVLSKRARASHRLLRKSAVSARLTNEASSLDAVEDFRLLARAKR